LANYKIFNSGEFMLLLQISCAPNSPKLSFLNFFANSLPSQPFHGCHLGIHIFFTTAFLGAA